MTGALSPTHWAIIAVVVLLLFGAKRLPDAARGLGTSMRIFKAETASLTENDRRGAQSDRQADGQGNDPHGAESRPAVPAEPDQADSELRSAPSHTTTA